MGKNPQWLYFDSKLTTYAELSQIAKKQDIWFVTIRRRGSTILRRLSALPSKCWQSAVIDIPRRRHQRIRYVDERVTLRDYKGEARQIAVKGLGREQPTLFLTNNMEASARQLVMDYAREGLGLKRLPRAQRRTAKAARQWLDENYDVEHAPVFFGRDAEIRKVAELLEARRLHGGARLLRLVTVACRNERLVQHHFRRGESGFKVAVRPLVGRFPHGQLTIAGFREIPRRPLDLL